MYLTRIITLCLISEFQNDLNNVELKYHQDYNNKAIKIKSVLIATIVFIHNWH